MLFIFVLTGLFLLISGTGYLYQDYKDYGKDALYNQEGYAIIFTGSIFLLATIIL